MATLGDIAMMTCPATAGFGMRAAYALQRFTGEVEVIIITGIIRRRCACASQRLHSPAEY
jgi:hypothetical protein